MSNRHPSENQTHRFLWLTRLIELFRLPERETYETDEFAAVIETVFDEEPMPEQFCQHSRWQRLVARLKHRLVAMSRSKAPDEPACPLCGLLPAEEAPVESVLRVWFHDGEIYEYVFAAEKPEDCYQISDSALHIKLKESVLSFSLDIIAAVHFSRRRVPPASPEVIAAERIIAGHSTD